MFIPSGYEPIDTMHNEASSSQAKIYDNFTNFIFKTKTNNRCFIDLKCTCKGLQKSISELER